MIGFTPLDVPVARRYRPPLSRLPSLVGMLVHQLSVLIVIANGMRLLRMPTAPRDDAADRGKPEQAAAGSMAAAAGT